MDLAWILSLLQLLFGQAGVVGTILIGGFAYVAWQLKLEQDAHDKTRTQKDELSEKRYALLEKQLSVMGEFRVALDNLTETVKRKKGTL